MHMVIFLRRLYQEQIITDKKIGTSIYCLLINKKCFCEKFQIKRIFYEYIYDFYVYPYTY